MTRIEADDPLLGHALATDAGHPDCGGWWWQDGQLACACGASLYRLEVVA